MIATVVRAAAERSELPPTARFVVLLVAALLLVATNVYALLGWRRCRIGWLRALDEWERVANERDALSQRLDAVERQAGAQP